MKQKENCCSTFDAEIAEIKKRADELDKFFSASLDLLCIADTDGNFVKTNDSWADTLGLTPAELNNRKFLDFVHPDDMKSTIEAMSALGRGEKVLNFVNRYRRRDGTYRFIEWRSYPEGKLIYAAARDVTDRIRVETALKESESRLNLAMAVKNEGLWDWNPVTNEAYFDERYYTMAGYQPNEFPQTFDAWRERVHPDDLPHAETELCAYLDGRSEKYDVDFRYRRKDGSWMWIEGRGRIFQRDQEGRPLRVVGTHTDITDRKEA